MPPTPPTRMELQAALECCNSEQLPRHPDLTLRTDSKYLIDGLGSWIKGWKRKAGAAGKPVLIRTSGPRAARLDDPPELRQRQR